MDLPSNLFGGVSKQYQYLNSPQTVETHGLVSKDQTSRFWMARAYTTKTPEGVSQHNPPDPSKLH